MYILNTSFMVTPDVHARWYDFVTSKFIPRLQREEWEKLYFSRVLSDRKEDHYTYSLMIHLPDIPAYRKYTEELFDEYLEIAVPLFADKVFYLHSLMKKIDL